MVVATDLFHMMDPSGAPQNVNFDEPVATFDARYVVSGAEAPVGAEYVVISLDADLTDERVLTGTANQIAIADGGAGGNVTLSTPQDIHTAATPEFDGVIIGSADGIDYNPGADIDTDLISVGVTGVPLLKWDESENAFDFSTIIALPTTSSTVGQIKQNGNRVFHTYGTNNLFIGEDAGNFTLSGVRNTSVGASAGAAITTGDDNVLIGSGAGESITEGDQNFCMGTQAGDSLTLGNYNFFMGAYAGAASIANYSNIGIGQAALEDLIDGNDNVAIGSNALRDITETDENVAIGTAAMRDSTGADAKQNVAIGAYSATDITAQQNVIIGHTAAEVATTSWGNTIIGFQAGRSLTTGDINTLIGYRAGDAVTTGTGNIIIGYNADPSGAGVSYELAIGDLITGYLSAHGSGRSIHFMGGTPQSQQAHIVDADGTLADITTKFNTLLADLEGYGLLAAV